MKFLVVGARGFLGSGIVRRMHQQGDEVIGVDVSMDALSASLWPNDLAPARQLDVLEDGALCDLIRDIGPQMVINAAGANLPTWQRDPKMGRRRNVELPTVIATAACAYHIPLTHISCKSIYGRKQSDELDESMQLEPETLFGREILKAERNLFELAGQGLDVRIIRACAVYGPAPARDPSINNSRFARMLALLLGSREVELIGSSHDSRNEYLFIDDFAEAVDSVARFRLNGMSMQEVFNVGTGRLTGLEEIAASLRRLFPSGRVCVRSLPSEFDNVLPPLSIRRIAATVGWQPRTQLQHGLEVFLKSLT